MFLRGRLFSNSEKYFFKEDIFGGFKKKITLKCLNLIKQNFHDIDFQLNTFRFNHKKGH